MKHTFKYIFTLSVILGIAASCALKEDMLLPNDSHDTSSALIVASVENFSKHNVKTKAGEGEDAINDLAMIVFGGGNTETERQMITPSPVYVEGDKLQFVINTNAKYISNIQSAEQDRISYGDFTGNLTNCTIYIVANANSAIQTKIANDEDGAFTEKDLLDISFAVNDISIPVNGFPMIGSKTGLDLNTGSALGSGSEVAEKINLQRLFAKINVRFQVDPNTENVPGDMQSAKKPYFQPINWSVHNIPSSIKLRGSVEDAHTNESVFATSESSSFAFSEASASEGKVQDINTGDHYCDFSFYIPEYKVLPARTRENVKAEFTNIPENLLQCHKPTLCNDDQFPTYVRINGGYSNHQGFLSTVQYRLFLGQNEIDDFQIKRNQELNNTATIIGLTNHSGHDQDISIDHRVDVTSSGYTIEMERETLLDSHFEFRPMDVSVQGGAVVVLKIPMSGNNEGYTYDWFSAERADDPKAADNMYVPDLNKRGLRKYFTTDLVSSLKRTYEAANVGDTLRFVLDATSTPSDETEKFRIWFYFDENTNIYDPSVGASSNNNDLFRKARIYVDHFESGANYSNNVAKTRNREFEFRQMRLWAISATDAARDDYSIEYFEEYLYNYASDDNYDVIKDGMPWGLDGIQISNQYQAIWADESNMGNDNLFTILLKLLGWNYEQFYNTAFRYIDAKYDFYLTRDGLSTSRDYQGLQFTKEIVNNPDASIAGIRRTLSEVPESAAEYCFNKNKRNTYGEVETIHWYLPAIDETEEILTQGFDYFQVFQSRLYWSSQPAYETYSYRATSWTTYADGFYYKEDDDRARSTKITATGGNELSGVDGVTGHTTIDVWNPRNAYTDEEGECTPQAGNKERTSIQRVRCAYNREGIEATSNTRQNIYGTYDVTVTYGWYNEANFTITISESDDFTKGDVKLSTFAHYNEEYRNTDYPQYAEYNSGTGILSIPLGEKIGTTTQWVGWPDFTNKTFDVISAYNNNSATSLTLQFNGATNSFSVVGDNTTLRAKYEDNNGNMRNVGDSYTIESFIKQ